MASKAAAAKTKEPTQRELAEGLLQICRLNRADDERRDGIKAALKRIATDAGENFRELFPDNGLVKVRGAKDKRFTGTAPEVDPEKWAALSKKEQNALLKTGVVKMVHQYVGASY